MPPPTNKALLQGIISQLATMESLVEQLDSAGGVGVEVLEDPGNVWEPDTAVVAGYRIAAVLPNTAGDSTPRVFEVVTGGTTESSTPDGFADDASGLSINLIPLGLTDDLSPVTWRYMGKVGELSWTVTPQLPGLRVKRVGSVPLELEYQFAGDPANSENLLTLAATVAGEPVLVFELNSDGDADWFFEDGNGPGMRWNNRGNSHNTQITSEGFRVTNESGSRLEVQFDPFTIRVIGLPTADPNVAGQLWCDEANDGVLKRSAGA